MTKALSTAFLLLLLSGSLQAQHDSSMHNMPQQPQGRDVTPAQPKMDMNMDMTHEHASDSMPDMMNSGFSRHLPMSRDVSGTAWQPDASPVFGHMYMKNKWMLMLHYNAFLRYTSQNINHPNNRGESEFSFPNWFMGMAQRKIGSHGTLMFRAMVSLDALTDGGDGYPLLLQTGETWQGKPLVDRQHPHDLLSELSVAYSYSFNRNTDFYTYLAYPGEPALGPPAFMHRASALPNPDAPIGHHWQDATHITFGVATAGFRYKIMKLEGSLFNGREPDENRSTPDMPHFDSYSLRLSANPNKYLSLQASAGYIHSPEALHPEENITRATVSAIHSLPQLGGFQMTNTVVLATNILNDGLMENSVLAETDVYGELSQFYARYEFVQKDAQELVLDEKDFTDERLFDIHAITIGGQRVLAKIKQTALSLGVQMTVNIVPDALVEPYYGKVPLSLQAYMRISPALLKM